MEALTAARDAGEPRAADAVNTTNTDVGSSQGGRLSALSTPKLSIRGKMPPAASDSSSPSISKEPVPPRRPTTVTTARRPAAAATTTTTTPRPATSRTSAIGSSLNKPPTRPAPGTAARKARLAGKPASSDAEPDLSSVTSGDENKKPPVRRAPTAASAGLRSPGKASSSASQVSSSTAAARRPATARTATEASTVRSNAASRASLAASTTKITAARPNSTRVVPGSAVRLPAGEARRVPPPAPEARDTASRELISSIELPSTKNGPPQDKAASDAEAESRRRAPASLNGSLAESSEDKPRPGTAPTGAAGTDAEIKRRSVEIMQDFFKETTMREKLQAQCERLGREIDHLQFEKEELREQLTDAQTAIVNKDSTTLVKDMQKKFAQEAKQLEEQSLKLEIEKKLVQEKLGVEATRASELQQVLDDLNQELEQQGREWDAEKKKLVEQAGQIEELTQQVMALQRERETFAVEFETSRETVVELQKKLTDVEQDQSENLASKDKKISDLTRTINDLLSEIASSRREHEEALKSTNHGYTEELCIRDAAITEHLMIQDKLRDDIAELQARVGQVSHDLQAERDGRAESIQYKVEEISRSSDEKLRLMEEEVSGYLKSIDSLQEQIVSMQQGSSDSAKMTEVLHKQIESLKESHEAALKIKVDENDELMRQLGALNTQLSSGATELEQRRQEIEGFQKNIQNLEESLRQEKSTHASSIAAVQAESDAAKEEADAYRSQLDAAHDKHQQELRALSEEHEDKIRSIQSDLEAKAKSRLDEVKIQFDSLSAEKNRALEQHQIDMGKQSDEAEALRKELSLLQQSSESAMRDLAKALDEHQQVEDDKSAIQRAHTASMKSVTDLQARVDELVKNTTAFEELQAAQAESSGVIADLQARYDALLAERIAAENAHDAWRVDSDNASRSLLEEMQKKHDVVSKKFSDLHKAHGEVVAEKALAQEAHDQARKAQQAQIEKKYATLLEAVQRDIEHLEHEKRTALDELILLKKEHSQEIEQLRAELDSKNASSVAGLIEATEKYEALLAERTAAESDHEAAVSLLKDSLNEQHESALSEVQSRYAALQKQMASTDKEHGDAVELLKEEMKAGHSNDLQILQEQLDVIQKQHTSLMEQKAAMERAHEDAISDLMMGMEASTSDAVQQLQKKYDMLTAQLEESQSKHLFQQETLQTAHTAELEAARRDTTEQQVLYRELLSRHDKVVADADAHAGDVKSLMETIHKIEMERDRATKATEEAEDRVETIKDEAVRKHLARVEPLEKENARLFDKIERLEAIIAAGDRIARAATAVGEKRRMNSPAEEMEVEMQKENGGEEFTVVEKEKVDDPSRDVIGTLAAMQETLDQLNQLNNDAIAESSRTAQRLTEQN